jgi:leucyl-tRNA synthetase
MDEANVAGASALNTKIIFDEMDVLKENIDFIKRALSLSTLTICYTTGENAGSKADDATPGAPAFEFVVTSDEDLAAGVANMLLG